MLYFMWRWSASFARREISGALVACTVITCQLAAAAAAAAAADDDDDDAADIIGGCENVQSKLCTAAEDDDSDDDDDDEVFERGWTSRTKISCTINSVLLLVKLTVMRVGNIATWMTFIVLASDVQRSFYPCVSLESCY